MVWTTSTWNSWFSFELWRTSATTNMAWATRWSRFWARCRRAQTSGWLWSEVRTSRWLFLRGWWNWLLYLTYRLASSNWATIFPHCTWSTTWSWSTTRSIFWRCHLSRLFLKDRPWINIIFHIFFIIAHWVIIIHSNLAIFTLRSHLHPRFWSWLSRILKSFSQSLS